MKYHEIHAMLRALCVEASDNHMGVRFPSDSELHCMALTMKDFVRHINRKRLNGVHKEIATMYDWWARVHVSFEASVDKLMHRPNQRTHRRCVHCLRF